MLCGTEDGKVHLEQERSRLGKLVPAELQSYLTIDSTPTTLRYPLKTPPEKIKSLNLTKNPEFSGALSGVRGQYLVFEGGAVLNIRRHTGIELVITA